MKEKSKKIVPKKRIKDKKLEGQLSLVVPHSERITGIVRDIDEDFIHMKVRRTLTSNNYIIRSYAIDRLVGIFLKKEKIKSIGEVIGKKVTVQLLPAPTQVDVVKGEIGFMDEGFTYVKNKARKHMLVVLSDYAVIEAKDPDNGRKKKPKDDEDDD